ncbi:MAG: BlaI/MecI/CopY family transcriptional regulator [Paenibacillus dendritiformis]|uniref:BlaI/MecI/CopY family transcriptional regulator n=1 Tax=uncultured Paenibacillus sp. TaxID=227322 RepID=UPI0025D8772F|nr:BlaI/MecI/CopY family transcriptional regulator [uncultured Paenibacillus sp.]MDU5145416.1 BlaI/MecI/CopY family transcriptional regulator [Paenibacillus dendritiformis]
MSKWQRISEAEKQIMEIVWSHDGPITTAEIIKGLPEDKAWKQNTVITFLARLMEKGIIKATRVGKANHYEACLTEKEYRNLETRQFIQDVHRGSVSGLISALCDNGDLKKEDIEEIMKRLKE